MRHDPDDRERDYDSDLDQLEEPLEGEFETEPKAERAERATPTQRTGSKSAGRAKGGSGSKSAGRSGAKRPARSSSHRPSR